MNKGRLIIAVIALLAFLSPLAFSNGLNLNSLGTKALAMGGAFVGLADDYSAVFWNPAGIAQFDKKYVGFYGTDIIPSMTYTLEVPTLIGPITLVDAKSMTEHFLAGMAAYYHPISENLVAGFAVYAPSGLGIEWPGEELENISGPALFPPNPNIKWRSKIFVLSLSPVLAFKLSDKVMFGATLNINYGSFETAQYGGSAEILTNLPPPYPSALYYDLGQQTLDMTGWGIGATFGLLVKPSEMFSLGFTFRTPSKIPFKGTTTVAGIPQLAAVVGPIDATTDVEADVTWPMWLCAGIAVKPVDRLTLTADAQYTQWSKMDEIEIIFTDPVWSQLMEISEGNKLVLEWESKVQFRFGAEFMATDKFAIRGGYYFDPSPAPNDTMNILLPIADFTVFSFGLGYNIDGVAIDLGAEYLKGKERDIPYGQYEEAMPGLYNLKILALQVAIGYRW
jgi:long-chain fatty acid transport protein